MSSPRRMMPVKEGTTLALQEITGTAYNLPAMQPPMYPVKRKGASDAQKQEQLQQQHHHHPPSRNAESKVSVQFNREFAVVGATQSQSLLPADSRRDSLSTPSSFHSICSTPSANLPSVDDLAVACANIRLESDESVLEDSTSGLDFSQDQTFASATDDLNYFLEEDSLDEPWDPNATQVSTNCKSKDSYERSPNRHEERPVLNVASATDVTERPVGAEAKTEISNRSINAAGTKLGVEVNVKNDIGNRVQFSAGTERLAEAQNSDEKNGEIVNGTEPSGEAVNGTLNRSGAAAGTELRGDINVKSEIGSSDQFSANIERLIEAQNSGENGSEIVNGTESPGESVNGTVNRSEAAARTERRPEAESSVVNSSDIASEAERGSETETDSVTVNNSVGDSVPRVEALDKSQISSSETDPKTGSNNLEVDVGAVSVCEVPEIPELENGTGTHLHIDTSIQSDSPDIVDVSVNSGPEQINLTGCSSTLSTASILSTETLEEKTDSGILEDRSNIAPFSNICESATNVSTSSTVCHSTSEDAAASESADGFESTERNLSHLIVCRSTDEDIIAAPEVLNIPESAEAVASNTAINHSKNSSPSRESFSRTFTDESSSILKFSGSNANSLLIENVECPTFPSLPTISSVLNDSSDLHVNDPNAENATRSLQNISPETLSSDNSAITRDYVNNISDNVVSYGTNNSNDTQAIEPPLTERADKLQKSNEIDSHQARDSLVKAGPAAKPLYTSAEETVPSTHVELVSRATTNVNVNAKRCELTNGEINLSALPASNRKTSCNDLDNTVPLDAKFEENCLEEDEKLNNTITFEEAPFAIEVDQYTDFLPQRQSTALTPTSPRIGFSADLTTCIEQTTELDQFVTATSEIFQDPTTFDFLLAHTTAKPESRLAAESLYVNFDPLVGNIKMLPQGNTQPTAEEQNGKVGLPSSLTTIAVTNTDVITNTSATTGIPNTTVITSTTSSLMAVGTPKKSPAIAAIDRLLFFSPIAQVAEHQASQEPSLEKVQPKPEGTTKMLPQGNTQSPAEDQNGKVGLPSSITTVAVTNSDVITNTSATTTTVITSTTSPLMAVGTPKKSPAIAAIDRLLFFSPIPQVPGHQVSQEPPPEKIQPKPETKQESPRLAEVDVSKELQDVRAIVLELEEQLEKQKQEHEQEREKENWKNKELEKQNTALQEKLTKMQAQMAHEVKTTTQMTVVVEEYEKSISRLLTERERDRANFEQEKTKIQEELQAANVHLTNTEAAFNDVHQKYERLKGVVSAYKSNEAVLKESIQENLKTIKGLETRYDQLKSHAMAQLEKANFELDAIRKQHEDEIVKLQALVRKAELKSNSLAELVEQKTKENKELSQILDEVIARVGHPNSE